MNISPEPSASQDQGGRPASPGWTSRLPDGTPSPHPTSPAGQADHVFFGRFGLRAGFGIALMLMLTFLLSTLGTYALRSATAPSRAAGSSRHQAAPGSKPVPIEPGPAVKGYCVPVASLLFAAWIMAHIERRRFRVYGLGPNRLPDVFAGAFWGFSMLSLLVFALASCHLLVFDGRALAGASVLRYGSVWILCFLLTGIFEEYSFRGYLQYTLMRGLWGGAERLAPTGVRAAAFWVASVSLSFVFLAAHLGNGGETFVGLFQVFLAGIVLAYGLWRTGSLWWSIGFHATWDWAQSFFYGTPDSGLVVSGRLYLTHPQGRVFLSGGSDGPEGSIFATGVLLLTLLVIRFTTRPGTQPALEPVSGPPRALPPSALHSPAA